MHANERLLDDGHIVEVLPPVANAFAGTVTTAPIRATLSGVVEFLVQTGVGLTGTTLITVEACNDAVGTGATAIPFQVNAQPPGANTSDIWGGYSDNLATGYTTVAGSNKLISIYVNPRTLPSGQEFVRLKMVEQVASPVAGGVVAILRAPRYQQVPNRTALA